ncbi:MAG: hypothetical protein ACI9SQ_000361 [Rubritalea sp.]|jgi:hypothetical protein
MKINFAYRLTALLVCGIIMTLSYRILRASDEERTVYRMTASGNTLLEQEDYSNEAVDEISKLVKKYQLQDVNVAVWKEKRGNPYGTEFMFRLALDYFRVPDSIKGKERWRQTIMIEDEKALAGIDYVISNKTFEGLPVLGYQSVFDKGWLHLYRKIGGNLK